MPNLLLVRGMAPEPPSVFLQQLNTIMIARVINIFSDPRAGASPLIPRSLNTSTFRVFLQDDPSEWITISDAREESVLAGFSRVGGLWAFLCGVFTVYFGTSLLRIICGKIFVNNLLYDCTRYLFTLRC